MNEQELRDYTDMVPKVMEYCGTDYYAEFARLDDETLAMRILHDDHETVAMDWKIANFHLASALLQWADAGGNWKEEVGE